MSIIYRIRHSVTLAVVQNIMDIYIYIYIYIYVYTARVNPIYCTLIAKHELSRQSNARDSHA